MAQKHVTFGIMLQGPGGHMNAWKHPSGPADASVNFDFFVKTARKAEAVKHRFRLRCRRALHQRAVHPAFPQPV